MIKNKKSFSIFLCCKIALIVVGIVSLALTMFCEKTVSTEIVEGIVTNTDYSTHYIKNSGTETSYIVAVRGD